MNESRSTVRNSVMTSSVITLAMMGSVIIYVVIAVLFVKQGQTFTVPGVPGLHAVLIVAALLSASGGLLFFRMQAKLLAQERGGAPPELVLARLLRARILGLALAETAAIIGLVLTLISGNTRWSVALGLVALAAMAGLWPKRRQLEGLAFPGEAPPIEPQ